MEKRYDVNDLNDNYINKINDDFSLFWALLSKAYDEGDVDTARDKVRVWLGKMDMNGDFIDNDLHFDDEPDYCYYEDIVKANHAMEVWEMFCQLRDKKKSLEFINAVKYFVDSEDEAHGL